MTVVQPALDDIEAEPFDVFISYSHQDEKETDSARLIAELLERAGYHVWWDRSLFSGQDWPKVLPVKVRAARRVLALCSPNSNNSTWCQFEWILASETDKLVPFDLAPGPVPAQLSAILDRLHREPLNIDSPDLLERLARALVIPPSRKVTAHAVVDARRVDVSRIPTGAARLVGRSAELGVLHKAWRSCAPGAPAAQKTNVVVLHALGGAGKTALLRRFIDDLANEGFPAADRVFGWSAYSQGSGENRAVSPETMIADCLEYFGGERPSKGKRGVIDRVEVARQLVGRVRAERSIILLDGIEPLQDTPHVHRGQLKHPDLRRLIVDLSVSNPGLIIVTSRQRIVELDSDVSAPRVLQHPLDRLSISAGTELLLSLHVHGRKTAIEAAVEETDGHALTLTVLGSYLDAVEGGNIDRRDQFGLKSIVDTAAELGGDDQTARLAKRTNAVMRGYVQTLKSLKDGTAGGGQPELAILTIMGLFERPAERAAMDAIFDGPAIRGVTGHFEAISLAKRHARWAWAIKRLRDLKLINAANPAAPDTLDAHPVVRQFFRERLRSELPSSWAEANRRLYEYYSAKAEPTPSTLAEMQPLFDAITHGCAAGLQDECWRDIYWPRINRGTEYFLTASLGAFAADLAVLSRFFASPWQPETCLLGKYDRRRLFDMAGRRLDAIGRARDAVPLLRASYDLFSGHGQSGSAAKTAGFLSETYLTIGPISEALRWSEAAVLNARDDEDMATRDVNLLTALGRHGEALLVSGDPRLALEKCETALAIQLAKGGGGLASFSGYRYACALLANGQVLAAKAAAKFGLGQEAKRTKRRRKTTGVAAEKWHLPTALLLSMLCEVKLAQGRPNHAITLIDGVVSEFRSAGSERFLPVGLLLRARVHRQMFVHTGEEKHVAAAAQDLVEAREIAGHGLMRMHEADCAIVAGALELARASSILQRLDAISYSEAPSSPWWSTLLRKKRQARAPAPAPQTLGDAQTHLLAAVDELRAASKLVDETGYHRRLSEIEQYKRQARDLEDRLAAAI